MSAVLDPIGRPIGTVYNDAEDAEAGITIANHVYVAGVVNRYGNNTTPGTTDMSDAFEAAFAQYAAGGKKVRMLEERYLTSRRLTVTSVNGLHMEGGGYSSVWTCAAASTFIFLLFQDASSGFPAINGVVLRDFRIDANGSGQFDAGVIQLNCCVGFYLENIWIENASRASGSQGVNGISMSSGSLGVGAQPSGMIVNAQITGCSKAAINASTETDWLEVIGGRFWANTGNGSCPGIQVFGGKRVRLAGVRCYQNEGAGIFIAVNAFDQAPTYCIFEDVYSYENGQGTDQGEGIAVQNAGAAGSFRLLIRGGHIYGNGVNINAPGVLIENVEDVKIDGANIYLNSGHGVRVDQSTNTTKDIEIVNSTIEANNQDDDANGAAVFLEGTLERVNISRNKFLDKQGTPTQDWGVRLSSSGTIADLTIERNVCQGLTNKKGYLLDAGMTVAKMRLDLDYELQTTDASNTNGPTVPLATGTAVMVISEVHGVEASDVADTVAYIRRAVVSQAAGTAAIAGSVQDGWTEETTETNCNHTIIVGGASVAPRVTGVAAETWNWRGRLVMRSIA